jgi:hypothetical protein
VGGKAVAIEVVVDAKELNDSDIAAIVRAW